MPFSAPAAHSSAPATPARSDVDSMALRNSRRVKPSESVSRVACVGRFIKSPSRRALSLIARSGKCKAKFAVLISQPEVSRVAAMRLADMLEFRCRLNARISGNRLENQPGRCVARGGTALPRLERGRVGDLPRANRRDLGIYRKIERVGYRQSPAHGA